MKLNVTRASALIVIGTMSFPAAHAWTSQDGPFTRAVHQRAIDFALPQVPTVDRDVLKEQQALIDKDQRADQSAEHAMTGLSSKDETEAVQRPLYIEACDQLIRKSLDRARTDELSGKHSQALIELSKAIHAMTDSTSPAHMGFQTWSFQEGIVEMAHHILQERYYPDDNTNARYRSHLQGAIRYAYDIFSGTTALPDHFFDSGNNGVLILPDMYLL